MKTVQEWLRSVDIDKLLQTYEFLFPIDLLMLEHKDVTVAELLARRRNNLTRLIESLRVMTPQKDADGKTLVFFGGKFICEGTCSPEPYLCYMEDIVCEGTPESYSYIMTDFPVIAGAYVADNPYTHQHIADVLAGILHEITFTGLTQEEKDLEKAKLDAAIQESYDPEKCYSSEEVWAHFGIEPEPVDEHEDNLMRKVKLAEHEFNRYCYLREIRLIREQIKVEGQN